MASFIEPVSWPPYGDTRRIPAPFVTLLKGKEEPLQCEFLVRRTESNTWALLGAGNVIWGGGDGYAFLCDYRLPCSGVYIVQILVTRTNNKLYTSHTFPEFTVYDFNGSSSNPLYWHRPY